MRDELEITINAMILHNWVIVLLAPRSKRPVGSEWRTTSSPGEVRNWVEGGGNIGLFCGPASKVVVLDFDDTAAATIMMQELGPLPLTVITGRSRWHTYTKYEDNLPPKIFWRGKVIGEVQRGPNQHVVMPPSVHPDTNLPYSWAGDQMPEVTQLPESWREYLLTEYMPAYIPKDRAGQPEEEVWLGPSPEEILRRAMQQPGAVRRRSGVKFQCPGCRRLGRDRHRDNAMVGNDGRWGCAIDPNHKRDIMDALGVHTSQEAQLNTALGITDMSSSLDSLSTTDSELDEILKKSE